MLLQPEETTKEIIRETTEEAAKEAIKETAQETTKETTKETNREEQTPILNNETVLENNEKGIALISTSYGDITLELYTADAPNTVSNFITLAKKGFYDGTKFHRVIPNFMVQGGDPLTKDDSLKGQWGTGGPGYAFADEIHARNSNAAGTISMANSGPNTNGSQFFLNVADNNFLDDKHTVFGIVTDGMDVVNAIVQAPTEGADRPIEAIVINSITIQ